MFLVLLDAERQKTYYKKNGMKIVGHFFYRNLLPHIRINTRWINTIFVRVGTTSNRLVNRARHCPDVEFHFDIFNFQQIHFTAVIERIVDGAFKRKIDQMRVYSFVSLIPIMRKYLEFTTTRFSGSLDTTEYEPWTDMTIHDSNDNLIDWVPLYEMSAETLIKYIFVAIDSEYLHFPVHHHPSYN